MIGIGGSASSFSESLVSESLLRSGGLEAVDMDCNKDEDGLVITKLLASAANMVCLIASREMLGVAVFSILDTAVVLRLDI
jgi:hypothetical protein